MDMSLSKLSLSLNYSDDHVEGDGFGDLVGRHAKLFLKYLGPLISKACNVSLPGYKSESCVMFQNMGQLAGHIGKYYLREMMKFWKKKD